MRVLICGATGNIGRLTVDKALKAAYDRAVGRGQMAWFTPWRI